jgi:protein SCO1/2
MNRRLLLLAAAAATLSAGCDRLSPSGSGATTHFNGVDITGADYRYSLPDVDGRLRSNADFKGKVTVVFFGYTQCPDVCPTTLAQIAQVKQALGADGDRVQGVFITVDPERDTPDVLRAYVGSFDPSFVALRGTPEQTAATAKTFKLYFAKSPGKTPDSYTVDHTAAAYVFDTEGRVRLFERHGEGGAEELAADVRALLAASAG